jgi:hypothetical protein
VVSVTSLWADERVDWPVDGEPSTPAHHFAQGRADLGFRTNLTMAGEVVARAVAATIPVRAVVADSVHSEDETFKHGLRKLKVGAGLALQPSHAWWHPDGTIGSPWAAALAARWDGPEQPGPWVRVERRFRDRHTEPWWALEVVAGPYGPDQPQRAVVVTTDPATRPALTTWYLGTNLPAPGSARARADGVLPAAALAEVVRLYGLRLWVEQSYKQTTHALGWSPYQVRAERAIRRHWALVCCAFSVCWYHQHHLADDGDPPAMADALAPAAAAEVGRGEKHRRPTADGHVARRPARGAGVAGAVGAAGALLARVVEAAPAHSAAGAA